MSEREPEKLLNVGRTIPPRREHVQRMEVERDCPICGLKQMTAKQTDSGIEVRCKRGCSTIKIRKLIGLPPLR